MAMDFDPVAAAFPCERGDMGFHFAADTGAPGGAPDGKITDTREIAGERKLGDKMEGKECDDPSIELIDEELFVRIGDKSPELVFQAGGRRIAQFGEKAADGRKIGDFGASDHALAIY
jgi:hypothetical protein